MKTQRVLSEVDLGVLSSSEREQVAGAGPNIFDLEVIRIGRPRIDALVSHFNQQLDLGRITDGFPLGVLTDSLGFQLGR